MEKIKVAIVGYGNIGRYAIDAVKAAPDMELVGLVRRKVVEYDNFLDNIKVVEQIEDLGKVDVAILCVPSKHAEENAKKYLSLGINTVDSCDIHTIICDIHKNLDKVAKKHNVVSVLAAGWDPGTDSMVRALLEACAPKGVTNTNFGPGMSMGHSVVAKSIEGVKDALSITIPLGTGIHRRIVYIELESNAVFNEVEARLKSDDYFKHDETHVIAVDDVSILVDRGHGVNMTRKGVSGETQNQRFEFNMSINNPALTSQIMVSCARAAMKQNPGAYTLLEIPIIDLLYGNKYDLIKRLV